MIAGRALICAIHDPVLSELWRRGREYPKRSDIDPIDIPRLLPFLQLVEPQPRTGRNRIRLCGTEIVAVYGGELTGAFLARTLLEF